MDGDGLDGLLFHVDVPDFDGEIVAGEDVAAIIGEADIGDGGYDFGEEGARLRVFFLLEHLRVVRGEQLGFGFWDLLFACWSQRALSRMSASLMVPLLLAYMNQLQLCG